MNTSTITEALPTETDVAIAREAARALAAALRTQSATYGIDVHNDDSAVAKVMLPASAMHMLLDVLTELGQGNAVSVKPIRAELTTQEAADMLNVSRPFLVQLLERSEIPFHKTGTHRRVSYQDVIAYKNRTDIERRAVLDALAAEAQELGMGY